VLEPSTQFLVSWHHELVAEYLTLAAAGQIRRLILNIPPRFTKSRLATVLWPCWLWARHPETNWIFGSYASELSTDHSRDRRTVLQSEWYQRLWGSRVEFAADQDRKTVYQNLNRGTMFSTSVGGTVLGMGADFIVVDDPHNPRQVLSDVERLEAGRWFDQQLSTRLNNPATGVIVVIMQRLHEDDLTGHVIQRGQWTHVSLRAEAEEDETIVFPLSGRVVQRKRGDALDPARFPKPVLDAQLAIMGSWAYAGQFQQRPVPLGGGIFKEIWFKDRWTVLPERFEELVQSWDCAFKETKDADFVCGGLWGRVGAKFYLIDQVREHLSFTQTCARIAKPEGKYADLWKAATSKLIEDKANGTAVIDTLKSRVTGVIAVEPEGGKESRAQAVAPLAEAGNVILPHDDLFPWVRAYVHELCAFPGAAYDDQVDQTTQALHRMKTGAASAANWTQFTQSQVLGDAAIVANKARGTVRTRG